MKLDYAINLLMEQAAVYRARAGSASNAIKNNGTSAYFYSEYIEQRLAWINSIEQAIMILEKAQNESK